MTPGAVLYLNAAASPHFTRYPILYQVAAAQPWTSHTGWVWFDGYELDTAGHRVERRAVYVCLAAVEVIAFGC